MEKRRHSNMQRILFALLLFSIAFVIVATAGPVSTNQAFHFLQTIAKGPADINTVDANTNGIIDEADNTGALGGKPAGNYCLKSDPSCAGVPGPAGASGPPGAPGPAGAANCGWVCVGATGLTFEQYWASGATGSCYWWIISGGVTKYRVGYLGTGRSNLLPGSPVYCDEDSATGVNANFCFRKCG